MFIELKKMKVCLAVKRARYQMVSNVAGTTKPGYAVVAGVKPLLGTQEGANKVRIKGKIK